VQAGLQAFQERSVAMAVMELVKVAEVMAPMEAMAVAVAMPEQAEQSKFPNSVVVLQLVW
jgi:hypothetical protein